MIIKLNGKERKYQSTLNLKEVINEFSQARQKIIAEVNGQIIKSPQWEQTHLNEGDQVELITFVGGG